MSPFSEKPPGGELGKHPLHGRKGMNTPGPIRTDERWITDPNRPKFSMRFPDTEAAERMKAWMRDVLFESARRDWQPLVQFLKARPDAIGATVIAEEVDRGRRLKAPVLMRFIDGDGRGRPSGSEKAACLIFYVAAAIERHGLANEERALHWIAEHRDEFPLCDKFESLKSAYTSAKRDPRFKPTLLWDITREELYRDHPQPNERR